MKQYFKGQPIVESNVRQYLNEKFNNPEDIGIERFDIISSIDPLLQNDYGLDGDCTVTALTCVLNYIHKTPIQETYNAIEKVDMSYGYNGGGTNPFLITCIAKKAEALLGVARSKWKNHYGKGIGYNFETIVTNIKAARPMVLNMFGDGRGYYSNHSVTIVGYMEYKIRRKAQRFLLIYDNWRKEVRYVDYETLSLISSINTYK